MPVPTSRRVLVVLGMHRGGTSAVAGMLHRLGVDFGPRLMPANVDNPAGYYEHNDVVNLHDRFLGRLGAAWDEPFLPEYDADTWPALAPAPGLPTYREELLAVLRRDFSSEAGRIAAPLWGLKDPRLCRLLPWWKPVWAALDAVPLFVIVLRSPGAVTASLGRRDGFSVAKSNLLWLQHLLRAERDTRGQSRCFVDYDRFMGDWRAATEGISRDLKFTWPIPPANLSPAEASFLDPALRHHAPVLPETRGPGESPLPWVDAVWSTLFPHGPGSDPGVLDDACEELARVGRVHGALIKDRETDLAGQLRAQRRLTRWYEEEWQKSHKQANELGKKLAQRDKKLLRLQSRLEQS